MTLKDDDLKKKKTNKKKTEKQSTITSTIRLTGAALRATWPTNEPFSFCYCSITVGGRLRHSNLTANGLVPHGSRLRPFSLFCFVFSSPRFYCRRVRHFSLASRFVPFDLFFFCGNRRGQFASQLPHRKRFHNNNNNNNNNT